MKAWCPQSHLHWFAKTRKLFDDVEAKCFVQGPGAMPVGSVGVEADVFGAAFLTAPKTTIAPLKPITRGKLMPPF